MYGYLHGVLVTPLPPAIHDSSQLAAELGMHRGPFAVTGGLHGHRFWSTSAVRDHPCTSPTQLGLKKSLNYVCYQGKKVSQHQYQSSFAACPSWPSGPEQGWLLPRHMDGDQDKARHHAANTGSHLTEAATSISTSLWH